MSDKVRGLYQKYIVHRFGDVKAKHTDCRYFVLDPQHDPLARTALAAYAMAARGEHPQLAADLDAWLNQVESAEGN